MDSKSPRWRSRGGSAYAARNERVVRHILGAAPFRQAQRNFTICCDFAWRDIHAVLSDIAVEM